MSTHPHYAQPEPTSDQPTTETPSTQPTTETASPTPVSERAPATFSRTRSDRLRNLIDEWNTAFAADGSKTS